MQGRSAQGNRRPRPAAGPPVVLRPARVFDGINPEAHEGWAVVVRGDRIEAAGPAGEVKTPDGARTIELPGMTLLPGLIDLHTHVLLHPYDEALWNDQVLKEALALRVCRATNHLKSTLLSGFTTIRDLGTEGARYADVGIKQAVDQGIVPGPRMLVVTRAIVATGSYAPKGFAPEWHIPQGAEEADGVDALIRVVRDQIGRGADWIKVYADTAMGGRSGPAVVLAGGDEADRRDGALGGRPGGGPCDVEGRDAPRRSWPAWRRSSTATAATRRSSS